MVSADSLAVARRSITDLESETLRMPALPSEWDAYFDLRWRVLRAPWQQARGSERDDFEKDSVHLMVRAGDLGPVAVGRLHFNSPAEAQIRFMAVDPAWQNRGFGGQILQTLENAARHAGSEYIVLNAREGAQRFYARHGYVVVGPAERLFDSIDHIKMRKDLT